MLADVVLLKQQLRSPAAVVASLLHISFTNIGRSATWPGKWIFRKTHQLKKQIGIYDHSCFSKISAAPQ